MKERLETAIIGDIVATDFRAAAVFEQFGIDFCCGGRRSLGDACRTAAADPAAVIRALDALPAAGRDEDDAAQLSLDRLIDHILSVHHTYVRSALPTIARDLAKLVEVHGVRHPELARVRALFDEMSRELEQHMLKEEQVLFPYVRDLAETADQRGDVLMSPFGTLQNPIRMMEREHREVGDELRMIRELTNAYTTPSDGCPTYSLCMAALRQFELDLHRYVHLENNVLFPKAIALESAG